MRTTKRVKIVTGLRCNAKCIFCYYQNQVNLPNRPAARIKKDLLFAKNHGIEEIDFSGGEPTAHPQLAELVSLAKSIGFKKICIISNGIKLADKIYCSGLKNAGLDEVLFSLHGPDEQIHDYLTAVAGSFSRINQGMTNISELGMAVRVNTVVNKINYNKLEQLAKSILKFNLKQANLITVNDWCFAKNIIGTLMCQYSQMAPYLKEACDIISSRLDNVNVRYIPFCFMKGYERFISNHAQVKYDPYEWSPRVRARLEIYSNNLRFSALVSYGYLMGGAYKHTFKKSFDDLLDECVTSAIRKWSYIKPRLCRQCRYYVICDGLEKTYAKNFGFQELAPVVNKDKIIEPYYFRRHLF